MKKTELLSKNLWDSLSSRLLPEKMHPPFSACNVQAPAMENEGESRTRNSRTNLNNRPEYSRRSTILVASSFIFLLIVAPIATLLNLILGIIAMPIYVLQAIARTPFDYKAYQHSKELAVDLTAVLNSPIYAVVQVDEIGYPDYINCGAQEEYDIIGNAPTIDPNSLQHLKNRVKEIQRWSRNSTIIRVTTANVLCASALSASLVLWAFNAHPSQTFTLWHLNITDNAIMAAILLSIIITAMGAFIVLGIQRNRNAAFDKIYEEIEKGELHLRVAENFLSRIIAESDRLSETSHARQRTEAIKIAYEQAKKAGKPIHLGTFLHKIIEMADVQLSTKVREYNAEDGSERKLLAKNVAIFQLTRSIDRILETASRANPPEGMGRESTMHNQMSLPKDAHKICESSLKFAKYIIYVWTEESSQIAKSTTSELRHAALSPGRKLGPNSIIEACQMALNMAISPRAFSPRIPEASTQTPTTSVVDEVVSLMRRDIEDAKIAKPALIAHNVLGEMSYICDADNEAIRANNPRGLNVFMDKIIQRADAKLTTVIDKESKLLVIEHLTKIVREIECSATSDPTWQPSVYSLLPPMIGRMPIEAGQLCGLYIELANYIATLWHGQAYKADRGIADKLEDALATSPEETEPCSESGEEQRTHQKDPAASMPSASQDITDRLEDAAARSPENTEACSESEEEQRTHQKDPAASMPSASNCSNTIMGDHQTNTRIRIIARLGEHRLPEAVVKRLQADINSIRQGRKRDLPNSILRKMSMLLDQYKKPLGYTSRNLGTFLDHIIDMATQDMPANISTHTKRTAINILRNQIQAMADSTNSVGAVNPETIVTKFAQSLETGPWKKVAIEIRKTCKLHLELSKYIVDLWNEERAQSRDSKTQSSDASSHSAPQNPSSIIKAPNIAESAKNADLEKK